MLNGLFIKDGFKTWENDYLKSEFWYPEKYDVNITPIKSNEITEDHIKRSKFVISPCCWELEFQQTLRNLKEKCIKTFLVSREPLVPTIYYGALFEYNYFFKNYGDYYFTPDLVLSCAEAYSDLWQNRAPTKIVGYTRFEQYLSLNRFNKKLIKEKYKLSKDKKIIFFPSFQSDLYKRIGDQDSRFSVAIEHEMIMKTLEKISKYDDMQVIVKIHPASQRSYNKRKSGKKIIREEVVGTLQKYYENKNDNLLVIGSDGNSDTSKELLFASDLVVGFCSTMLFEAMLLKKPIVYALFNNLKNEKGLFELENEFPTAYNEKDLENLIISTKKPIKDPKILEKYVGAVDGKFCERLCEAIKEQCQ